MSVRSKNRNHHPLFGRSRCIVWPDRFYLWTYYPTESKFNKSKKTLYKKHICCIPYYSRVHARHVLTYIYGEQANAGVHVILGKRLIAQGITTFKLIRNNKNVICIHINGKLKPISQWAVPPEYNRDSNRRVVYKRRLHERYLNDGRSGFDKLYKELNYGNKLPTMNLRSLKKKYSRLVKGVLHDLYKQEARELW